MPFEGEKFEEIPTPPPEEEEKEEEVEEKIEEEIEEKPEETEGKGAEVKEEGVEKLENFLKETSLELKEEGFPVKEDRRIDMEVFKEKYPLWKIERDQRELDRLKKIWEKESPEEGKRAGEKLEMFTTSIFDKFLGKDFFILRSSEYDDIVHGVDNIMIEKETGNPVCAFDEVADEIGPRFEEKKEKIIEKNLKGGATLEYGVKVSKVGEKTKVILTSERNLPVFYLPLSARHIEEGIEKFSPSLEEKSEYEERVFNYFLSTIKHQIDTLQLDRSKLNFVLRERLDSFEEKLKELKLIEEKEKKRFGQRIPKRRAIGIEF